MALRAESLHCSVRHSVLRSSRYLEAKFKSLDADGNGVLDKDEMKQIAGGVLPPMDGDKFETYVDSFFGSFDQAKCVVTAAADGRRKITTHALLRDRAAAAHSRADHTHTCPWRARCTRGAVSVLRLGAASTSRASRRA